MVLSEELSAGFLFVHSCFDCSELRVEESVVVSVWWRKEMLYLYRSEGFGASAEGLFGSVQPVFVH